MGLEFGKRLREVREQKSLTQLELAKQANLGESTISFYELGRREPNYDTLLRLAEILEVSPGYLLTGETNGNGHSQPWWERDELPSDIELEEFIREHSNIRLMGNPLDERAKDDVIRALRAIWMVIREDREKERTTEVVQRNGEN
jgi:transcriptional regulator with XRE-family HTH domain